MKAIKRVNNHSQNIIVRLARVFIVVGIVACVSSGFAQTLSIQSGFTIGAAQPDSIVQIAAESQGLAQMAPEDLPIMGGTFWWVMPGGAAVPAPCLPLDLSGAIYQIADGQFLVDKTDGQVVVNTPRSTLQAQSTSSTVASAVTLQVDAVVNLITRVQIAAANQQMRATMQAMGMDVPLPDDGSGTNSYDCSGGFQAQVFTTNDLWLQITGTTNTGTSITAYLVIHTPWNVANGVYDLFATTNLAPSAWQWVLRCAPGQTNLTVTNLTSPNNFFILGLTNDADGDGLSDAFELLVSHTSTNSPSTDGSGMSDGWEWQYFGSISNNPSADPDGDGLSNLQEYNMRSAGYNPTLWDSYGNGVSDAYEDYSGDGLANFMEPCFWLIFMYNNPSWKSDTTGDGLPDAYQVMAGSGALGLPAYSKNPIQ
jgi:hypothetical protein